ncbi:hypothetical protein I305_02069 [Cryptococcus gattii E566]|uniref:Uncharacterized protein n=2 Tax=Cryptococcus gattii TaxID=37769 RepID=E6RD57_CRYGW|nr:Hypothetical Protein CGB_K0430W [Cryptococcus gattii WM276]ADV24745.1 Hypothetical Protein CGB_K0430W [Cryptococcus gattii WM276]KIR79230.1 hypothetical protein I306_03649 [Cryptococcus gattii EJB2]KIY35163.1 hypothetical protein I305_02069 [Cryptococcus gattii E566]KJE05627.1 hypothetical protein I311_00352 [Cryptococcus gattii NT-10]
MWALILHPSNHHSIIIEALPPSYSQASGLSTICVDIKGDVAKIPLPTSPQDESRTPGPSSYHHNETKGRYDEDNVLYAECRTTNSRCQSVAIFAQIYRKQSEMNTRRITRDDRRLSRFKSEGG